MFIPDRVIVRKLKEYDPYLFVVWNNNPDSQFPFCWEVWRHEVHGRRLITPVIQSIYDDKAPNTFTPLDERILFWLVASDPRRLEGDGLTPGKRWQRQYFESIKRARQKRKQFIYDASKDAYRAVNNFYFTKKTETKSDVGVKKWVAPDSQAKTSPRLWARTKSNALAHNFRRK